MPCPAAAITRSDAGSSPVSSTVPNRRTARHGGVDSSADERSEQLAESYVSGLTAATGFRHDAATRLRDVSEFSQAGGPGEFFRAATNLRARLFAAAFGEHLRGRHGRRWFASRAAGDELIDVWNTASRHAVEELARLVWGGELGFDLLADSLLAAEG